MRTIILLSLICALSPFNQLFSQDASLIYKNTVNSTVTIITDDGSQGSGFFVAPNIIATNYHVMEGATNASCYLNNSDKEYKIDGYVGIDKTVDLILLKVSTLNKPVIKLAVTTASIGQKVYVIGSPRGLPATISDGIISGMRDFEGIKLLQMTASISPGSSGGPVLNSNGELLGISVSQLTDGQNLNFAIPKSYLQILLDYKKNTPMALSNLIPSKKPKDVPNSSSIIGKPIRIGNLEVAQNDFPSLMNWPDANKACAALGNGWRLPTKEEQTNMYLNRDKIVGFASGWYWSSTKVGNGGAWGKAFFKGGAMIQAGYINTYSVRAVRSL
ncbi:MAG: trypsin-like peptidase domain-containing protein [Crocinitomicaceae bacterium]|jgi:hypothetical protein|nr:trypsin-like peptidase domain-containing protein [Crocinitomicaceae bacterium]